MTEQRSSGIFHIQTDKLANQLNIVVMDKQERKVVVVDVAMKSYSNPGMKKLEKLERCHDLRDDIEPGSLIMVSIGSLSPVNLSLYRTLTRSPVKY